MYGWLINLASLQMLWQDLQSSRVKYYLKTRHGISYKASITVTISITFNLALLYYYNCILASITVTYLFIYYFYFFPQYHFWQFVAVYRTMSVENLVFEFNKSLPLQDWKGYGKDAKTKHDLSFMHVLFIFCIDSLY